MVYILHFEEPIAHAQHYVGFAQSVHLEDRIEKHRSGRGSRLTQVFYERGISFKVSRIIPGGRTKERKIKNWKCTPRICPICNPDLKPGKNEEQYFI